MGITTLLCLVCLVQDPAPKGPLDVVTLKNGETMTGRITSLLDGYIELQLEGGATVGFSTAQVQSVARGAANGESATPAGLTPRDDWFVLHDGQGAPVGWLHACVTTTPTGVRLVEEWEFALGQGRVAVTALETADPQLQPLGCYWHERVSRPTEASLLGGDSAQQERIAEERIVEGRVDGAELRLSRITPQGRSERVLAFPPHATFPMLLQAQLRRGPVAAAAAGAEQVLFDPQSEELVARAFQAGRLRTVQLDGKPLQVTELATTSAAGRSAEWLDASMRTVRREIAGPSLVAVPSSEASARAAAHSQLRLPPALVTDADGKLGMWLPNPSWQTAEGQSQGQVTAEFPLRQARCSLLRLDQLPAGTQLASAADATRRWFRLLYPGLVLGPATPARLRSCDALQMTAEGREQGQNLRAELHVLAVADGFCALLAVAPAAYWDELAPDFVAFQRTVEVDAQALTPRLQGPIAERQKQRDAVANAVRPAVGKNAPAPKPSPAPAPGATPAPGAKVRVVLDGDR